MTVSALQLDCSSSLVPKALSSFSDIVFDAGSPGIDKITTYEDAFTHTLKNDCLVQSCSLMTSANCAVALPSQANIVLGP